MTLIKVRDFPPSYYCQHPAHNPPTMMVLSPGEYEHTCPGCGAVSRFMVYPRPMCSTSPTVWSFQPGDYKPRAVFS